MSIKMIQGHINTIAQIFMPCLIKSLPGILPKHTLLQSCLVFFPRQPLKFIFLGAFGLVVIIIFTAFYLARYKKKQRMLSITKRKTVHRRMHVQRIFIEAEEIYKTNERLEMELECRVRQNLNLVIALLDNQFYFLDNLSAREAIAQSQSRLKAMLLAHQLIYNLDGEEYVEISGFIKQLVENLECEFNVLNKVTIKYDLQLLNLKISRAETLGLLLNEIFINCFKLAFPDQDGRVIEISLQLKVEKGFKISIKDDGKYVSPVLFFEESKTLGTRLIRGLAGQLDATLVFEVDSGLNVNLDF